MAHCFQQCLLELISKNGAWGVSLYCLITGVIVMQFGVKFEKCMCSSHNNNIETISYSEIRSWLNHIHWNDLLNIWVSDNQVLFSIYNYNDSHKLYLAAIQNALTTSRWQLSLIIQSQSLCCYYILISVVVVGTKGSRTKSTEVHAKEQSNRKGLICNKNWIFNCVPEFMLTGLAISQGSIH